MDERNEQRPDSAEHPAPGPAPSGPGPAARAAADSAADHGESVPRGPGPAARAAAEPAEPAEPVRRGPGPAARAATEGPEPAAKPGASSDAPKDEGPSSRVIDAGTSQELVIINYSNDIEFQKAATGADRPARPHPSRREETADRSGDGDGAPDEPVPDAGRGSASREDSGHDEPLELAGSEPAAEEPDPEKGQDDEEKEGPRPGDSLVIVRNMADQFALEEHQALKPDPVTTPPKPPVPSGELQLDDAAPGADSPAADPTGADSGTGETGGPGATGGSAPASPPPAPAPFAKKEKPQPTPEEAAEAERRRELSDVLGVDWESELDFRSNRAARRPSSSSVIPPVARPAPSRGGRAARSPEPAPAPPAYEPEIPLEPPPRLSRPFALGSGVVFLAATVLMALRIEPFHTWYYLFAWYPMLLGVNHLAALRAPRFSIFRGRSTALLTMVAWSVPLWLVFEVFNFRLANWYYVGVPDVWIARRLGVIFAFATVLPGIFLLEETLRSRGWFERLRTPAFQPPAALPNALLALGGIWLLLVLVLPRFFFPLVWGIPVLLLEPWLFRAGGPSLLREISEGRPGRTLRLLAVGLFCGIFWESANYFAGGKWIYTVPGFDRIKLFEMPILGFAGFPPFALCCWVMARALVKVGLLPDPEPRDVKEPEPEIQDEDEDAAWLASAEAKEPEPEPIPTLPREVRIAGIVGAVLFSLAVLEFVDRATVDSFTARPEDVPLIPDGVAEYARGHGARDVRGLLRLIEDGRLYMPGESSQAEILRLEETCRLVLLRGIGTHNADLLGRVGIHSVGDLALWKPDELTQALSALDEPGWKPKPRRVNVWVAAARREYARR